MDPIAIDTPGKFATVPVALARPTHPPPAPRADAPGKDDAPAAEVTPPAAPPVPPGLFGMIGSALGLSPRRRRVAIAGLAGVSLAAGIAGVRMLWPVPEAAAPPTPPPQTETAKAEAPKPLPLPAASVEPAPVGAPQPPAPPSASTPAAPYGLVSPPDAPPRSPTVSAEPSPFPASPAAAKTTPLPEPDALPAFAAPAAPSGSVAPPVSDGFKPVAPPVMTPPMPDSLIPIGATAPAAPTAPAPPASGSSGPPPLPALPGGGPAAPAPLPAPSATPPAAPALPQPSGLDAPPAPKGPTSVLPDLPGLPSAPAAPGGGPAAPPAPPMGSPVPPATPAAPPVGLPAPVVGKSPLTEAVLTPPAPLVDKPTTTPVKPPVPAPVIGLPDQPPDLTPPAPTPPAPTPAPAAGVSQPGGVKLEFTKPAETPVKPAAPAVAERTPQTSFDVDLHEPRAGETYDTISREFYNDTRYGKALAEYNRRKPLQGGGHVEVPPIHVLKKRFPQLLGQGAATSGSSNVVAVAGEWGPAGGAAEAVPAFRPSGPKTYVVPPGGTTMPAVARLTLGNETRWKEIYDLNPRYTPDALAAGTELKLPADAVVPK